MINLTQLNLENIENSRKMDNITYNIVKKSEAEAILIEVLKTLKVKLENFNFEIVNRPTILGMFLYRKGMQFISTISFDDACVLKFLSDKDRNAFLKNEILNYDIESYFNIGLLQLSITLFPKS